MSNGARIPQEWRAEKLGNLILKVVGGGTPSREKEAFWNGNIPWATVKDLKKTILHDAEESITEQALKESAANLIPKGTLIIATRMALGKAVFFTKDVAINQDLKALFPGKELSKQYLFHWLQHNADVIERLGSGSTVKGIRLEVLKGLDFLLPPLTEQQKIAEILSTVDEKIAVIDEQLAQTQELKKGLMQRLLTRGIGHTTLKDSPLGQIPESWDVKKLGELSIKITDGSHFSPTPLKDTGYRIATVKDMKDSNFRLDTCAQISEADFKALVANGCKPEKGDVLFSKDGTIGKTFVFDGETDIVLLSSVAIIRLKNNCLPSYIHQVLRSHIFDNQLTGLKSGSAIKRLVLGAIRSIKVPMPSMQEQTLIAEVLTTADEKLQVLIDKKTQYHELKRGLMQQLLTGQRRVKVAEPAMT